MKLRRSSLNGYLYLLDDTPHLSRIWEAVPAYLQLISTLERKVAEIDPDNYHTRAIINKA